MRCIVAPGRLANVSTPQSNPGGAGAAVRPSWELCSLCHSINIQPSNGAVVAQPFCRQMSLSSREIHQHSLYQRAKHLPPCLKSHVGRFHRVTRNAMHCSCQNMRCCGFVLPLTALKSRFTHYPTMAANLKQILRATDLSQGLRERVATFARWEPAWCGARKQSPRSPRPLIYLGPSTSTGSSRPAARLELSVTLVVASAHPLQPLHLPPKQTPNISVVLLFLPRDLASNVKRRQQSTPGWRCPSPREPHSRKPCLPLRADWALRAVRPCTTRRRKQEPRQTAQFRSR